MIAVVLPGTAYACPSCAAEFRAALAELGWVRPLLALSSVAIVCTAAVVLIGTRFSARPALNLLVRSGLLIGIGFGGFVDGIVLHQILQWHGMVSAVLTPTDLAAAKVNMFWDGIFHLGMWLFAAAGVWTLWHAIVRRAPADQGGRFVAAAFLGWAIFNVVEGVVDHHLLGLHHVRDFVPSRAVWDWLFLGVSVVMGAVSAPKVLRRARGVIGTGGIVAGSLSGRPYR